MRIRDCILLILIAATVATTAAGCRSRPGEKLRTGPLYERVKKEEGLHEIASKVSDAVRADQALAASFAQVDLARFEEQLARFLCHGAGGPCTFDGALSEIWRGATLDDDQFMALMEAVITGMNDANLPQQEQNDLVDLLMAAHDQPTEPTAATATAAP